MRIGLATIAIMLLLVGLGYSRARASSCLSQANATSAAAFSKDKDNDPASAARLYHQAATGLQACLQEHPRELTIPSEQREGEMWMYSGEAEHEAGNVKMARTFLLRAKEVFSRLRQGGSLRGGVLDEILSEAHEVDSDLARASFNYYQVKANREAMAADFDAAIADWRRAAALSGDPRSSCSGEFERIQIRAAIDAKEKMIAGHLTQAQAEEWYETRDGQLWIPDKCNGP
jgi:hypothetical protein